MHNIDDETIGGLMIYLDDLLAKNRAEASKITPLKSAVKRVFSSVYGGEWEFLSVNGVDADELIERFKYSCQDAVFNEDTFAAYRARINRAIKWYKSYLADREWSPFEKKSGLEALLGQLYTGSALKDGNAGAVESRMVTYPFPLSTGLMVTLQLPKNLSRVDAERLKTFIGSLVTEER